VIGVGSVYALGPFASGLPFAPGIIFCVVITFCFWSFLDLIEVHILLHGFIYVMKLSGGGTEFP
jgi:hypothetical protein